MYVRVVKRGLDIIIGLILLAVLFLPMIIIGGIIFLEDRSTCFYNAERLGKDGNIFKMFKFRTMKVGAPDIRNEDGSTFSSEADPRLTKFGSFLRKSSLDEVPQLINVIKGDMSFVGPRPDLPEHLEMYSGDEARKLEVLPGITGYNQAYYRNSVEWKFRLKNDVYYVDHASFLLDAKIVLATFFSVIRKRNVYTKK